MTPQEKRLLFKWLMIICAGVYTLVGYLVLSPILQGLLGLGS